MGSIHKKAGGSFFPSCNLWLYAAFFLLQEIYSIKLPGDPKLGEGKPENQNHAIVFTRGDAVQTIDMNQVKKIFLFMRTVPHAFLSYTIYSKIDVRRKKFLT